MTDWTAGYVADIAYTYGYYKELNPLRIKLAFLNQGFVFPEVGNACELGFGQGLSTNLHASASVVSWHGTDFNPTQAGFAQEMSRSSGNNAKLSDESFLDFAKRDDLPAFDYIGLHGIWSWISDENRRVIVDFVKAKLKVGGVLYISYNTLPGWSAFAPMRHLMVEHAHVLGTEGRGIVSRVEGAMEFATKLLQTNPAFSRANPQVGDRLAQMKAHNRQYLAHEYFNADFHPMHFATMAGWLEDAKLQFVCSAEYFDHVDTLNLTNEQLAFLEEIPDAMFRESVRDFMTNQQFRKDYWVRGARSLSPFETSETMRTQKVILTTHRRDVALTVNSRMGEANLSAAVYGPVLDVLADHKVKTIQQIEDALRDQGISYDKIVEAIMMLVGLGHVSPVNNEEDIAQAKKTTDSVNAYLCKKAFGSNDINYVASPVIGGGFMLGRLFQIFLASIMDGKKQPADFASYTWEILAKQGQKLIKDGQSLDTEEDNLKELKAMAKEFSEKTLPILKALKVI